MKCDIYRSERREGMYLYIQRSDQADSHDPSPLNRVPDALKQIFGHATWVMSIDIDAQRQLAQVSGAQVLKSIDEKGYFVQLPPEGLINPQAVAPEGLRGA